MREMRRAITMAGLLSVALLPVAAAAVSPEPLPQPMPVAIAQPVAAPSGRLAPHGAYVRGVDPGLMLLRPPERLPEPGLLALVGAGLIGAGAMVRRTTSV